VLCLSVLAAAVTATGAASGQSLTLETAVSEALQGTRDILHARADLLLADVEKMRALSPILPRFDLSAGVRENLRGPSVLEQRGGPNTLEDLVRFQETGVLKPGPFQDTNVAASSDPTFTFQLRGQQLIYDGGRWWLVIGRANDLEREKRAALKQIENDTRMAVAQVFWDLEKARRGVVTVKAQVEVDLEQVARARAIVAAGVGKQNDLAAAERNLAEDRIALSRREQLVRARSRQLNRAIGRPSDEGMEIFAPEDPIEGAIVPPKDELLASALEARPELLRVRASLDMMQKNVGIARADYFPVIGLGAAYARQSRRPDRVYGDPTENYLGLVQLSVEWNLFNGRATTANVQQAEIELAKLQVTYDTMKLDAIADIEERLDQMAVSLSVYALSQESIRAAEEAVRLARGLYTEGRSTLLELRDAEVRLTVQKLAEIEARIDVQIAREELRRAAGGELEWARRP
jgi:outer membrane protein TolC